MEGKTEKKISLENFSFEPLSKEINLESFDCGDPDINEFLRKDSLVYQAERISSTYVFLERNDRSIVAFFSISNNCLKDERETQNFNKQVADQKASTPFRQYVEDYPGVGI